MPDHHQIFNLRFMSRREGPFGRRAVELSAIVVAATVAACEEAPSTVELWIEPPAVYRFGAPDALPLPLPDDPEGKTRVLAAALREAAGRSDTPEEIAVFAPYTGTGLNDPEYALLRRAACEAGIRDIELALVDPHDADAPLREFDPAAAAPYPPPDCGAFPVVIRSGVVREHREFNPDPPR